MIAVITLGVFLGLMLFRVFPLLVRGIVIAVCLHILVGWP